MLDQDMRQLGSLRVVRPGDPRIELLRLIGQDGLKGLLKYLKVITTNCNPKFSLAPNVLNREFTTDGPNQKWVADITYVPTNEGWLYVAGILDLFSWKIVGWDMSNHIDATLVEKALRMAFYQRQPGKGLLHNSDRGVQFASRQVRDIREVNGFNTYETVLK